MAKLTFSTTSGWDNVQGFGCASLGLAGICDNSDICAVEYPFELNGTVMTGSYADILTQLNNFTENVYAAIVLFGNAGGENRFIHDIQNAISCPIVGGGAAIDPISGCSALISGRGEAALFLITDDRYTYETKTKCIHNHILETCHLELADPRTLLKINGVDAAQYLSEKKQSLGIATTDFEHLTLSDFNNVNAHLSSVNGTIKSGRDLQEEMLLRYVAHEDVYTAIQEFYDDPYAIVFGCAGLSGLLDSPLQTTSLGLFLFGEVCTTDTSSEFGNLMLSKLRILEK